MGAHEGAEQGSLDFEPSRHGGFESLTELDDSPSSWKIRPQRLPCLEGTKAPPADDPNHRPSHTTRRSVASRALLNTKPSLRAARRPEGPGYGRRRQKQPIARPGSRRLRRRQPPTPGPSRSRRCGKSKTRKRGTRRARASEASGLKSVEAFSSIRAPDSPDVTGCSRMVEIRLHPSGRTDPPAPVPRLRSRPSSQSSGAHGCSSLANACLACGDERFVGVATKETSLLLCFFRPG